MPTRTDLDDIVLDKINKVSRDKNCVTSIMKMLVLQKQRTDWQLPRWGKGDRNEQTLVKVQIFSSKKNILCRSHVWHSNHI